MCVIEVPFYTFSHIIRPLGIQRQDIMLDEQPMGRGKKKKEGKNRGWSEIIPGFRYFGKNARRRDSLYVWHIMRLFRTQRQDKK